VLERAGKVAGANDSLEAAAAALPTAFDTGYVQWKSWESADFGRYSPLDARYYSAELGIRTPAAARVLEIGFGNGSVLAWLRDTGADTFGIEANPVLVARASELLGPGRVFLDLQDAMLSRMCGTFTHVIALDVLEHVPMDGLPEMLARIANLLAPAGLAVLRFPNGDSPFGRIYQHGDPTHITTLGSTRIAYFARRAGLEVVAVRSPALPVRGVGLIRGFRRLAIRGARHIVEYVVGQLYFGGQSIPFDPNYTAVLRRPESTRRAAVRESAAAR
jgi:2-polyprenyl-3-methyl-5-hydroxy-6-metoxy-1,4-benzoquinol methylase